MQKNDRFIGQCIGYTAEGLGIVKQDGFVFFVKDMIRGEEGEIVVTSLKKSYGFGKCLKIVKENERRVLPSCSIYKLCGGCQLQHMNPTEQNHFKEGIVRDCIERIGKVDIKVNPILGADSIWRYRNKVQVPVQSKNGKACVGFYRNHSNEIVEFEDCLVQSELSNKIIQFCKIKMEEFNLTNHLRRVLIKHAHKTNQVLVCFVMWSYSKEVAEKMTSAVVHQFSEIKSVVINVNKRKDNVLLSDEEYVVYGTGKIQETLRDLTFTISSKSFYQINPDQTLKLYEKAIELAKLKSDETVVDLYCGTGTIGLFAAKSARNVYGVEIVHDAIEDAKINAQENQVENIEFLCADAKDGAKELQKRKIEVDVVIVDPPRKGCDEETLKTIIEMNPKRIVYVSCDPSTLSRDIKVLSQFYNLEEVQPVDMFPMTYHVEAVASLVHKNKD